jgi:cysteine synthase B
MTKTLGSTILERIGNTPLASLGKITAGLPGIEILGKVEWANPGGSVKDRAASSIVADAIASGEIGPKRPDRALLDATSGNTGIAYAMLGAALGFKVQLCMPSNVSPERKRLLAGYGAEIVWTDPDLSSDGAILKAREMAAEQPEKFYYADQYSNDNNWKAHYRGTANEIWEQTEGRLTHFVTGVGTSGTFMGTTRRLKELNPKIKCIAMQPDSPFHGLEGMKHMESAMKPAIWHPEIADRQLEISTEEAYRNVKRLGRLEGILMGVSSAANVTAALQIAKEEVSAGREAVIVTILCDSADKYLSERFWDEIN